MLLRTYVFLLALGCSVGVFAQDNWDFAAPQKGRCSVGTMVDMTRCLEKELNATEKRLNVEYQSLLRSLESAEPLRRAQGAWLRFRELECNYVTSGIGESGSLYPFSRIACNIDLTEKRIRDLRRYASWEGAGAPHRK